MEHIRSALDEVFLEEYDRVLRRMLVMQKELAQLPKGSVSRKVINGSEAFYLCFREGDKVISKHLKKSDVEEMRTKVERRRFLEKSMRESRLQAKKLEKALGKAIVNEYHTGKHRIENM